MSRSNDDLPGFYRDPVTGRYYREKPGDVGNSSLEKLKFERERERKVEKIQPRIRNVTSYLNSRELGTNSGGVLGMSQFYEMKTRNKKLIYDVSLNSLQLRDVRSIDFIRGSERSVYGTWTFKDDDSADDDFHYLFGEQSYFNSGGDEWNAEFRMCSYIIDLCPGPFGNIICLYSEPFPHSGCFEYITQPVASQRMFFCTEPLPKSSMLCCNSGKSGSVFAIGGEGIIRLFTDFRYHGRKFVNGNIHSLSFDESGKTVILGIHNGSIILFDNCCKEFVASHKISDFALNDSLYFDNKAIISDVNGKLVKFDLRMNAIVAQYHQHCHSVKRTPFSATNGLLCASGADNVIRIWHISGGDPIDEIRPQYDAKNKIRGWLNSDGNKIYLNYFEADRRKVFEII